MLSNKNAVAREMLKSNQISVFYDVQKTSANIFFRWILVMRNTLIALHLQ